MVYSGCLKTPAANYVKAGAEVNDGERAKKIFGDDTVYHRLFAWKSQVSALASAVYLFYYDADARYEPGIFNKAKNKIDSARLPGQSPITHSSQLLTYSH